MADLTTASKVKTFLGISSSTYDMLLASLVSSISSQVETFCNRTFVRGTYTEYFDTELGDKKIFPSNYPIVSLTSVQYQTGTWDNLTWLDFPASYYLLNSEMGKISFGSPLPEAEKYIKVVYVGGYLIDFANETDNTKHTLPADLSLLVTEMAAQSFNNRQAQGISNMSTEGQSITYKEVDINKDLSSRLSRYINYN